MPHVFDKRYRKPNIWLPIYLNSNGKWNNCVHYCKNPKKFDKYLNKFHYDMYIKKEMLEEIIIALLKDMTHLFGYNRNMEDCAQIAIFRSEGIKYESFEGGWEVCIQDNPVLEGKEKNLEHYLIDPDFKILFENETNINFKLLLQK